MVRKDGWLPVLSVLAAASLWGMSGPAQALAHTGVNPAALGAARLLLGGLALAAVALSSGQTSVRSWLCGDDWRWLALAAVSTGVFQAAFFAAVDRTGAALATLVALGAAPVATGLCARSLRGEPLRGGWAAATVSAVAGCALLLLPGGTAEASTVGIAFALVAACCYGGYTVAGKQLVQADRPVEGVIAASLVGGALILAPAFADHASRLLSVRGILLAGWLGLVSTALAYTLFVRGLRRIPASIAGTLSLAEPLVAVVLAVLVLGEHLGPAAIVGALLLLAGIALASVPILRRSVAERPLTEAAG